MTKKHHKQNQKIIMGKKVPTCTEYQELRALNKWDPIKRSEKDEDKQLNIKTCEGYEQPKNTYIKRS